MNNVKIIKLESKAEKVNKKIIEINLEPERKAINVIDNTSNLQKEDQKNTPPKPGALSRLATLEQGLKFTLKRLSEALERIDELESLIQQMYDDDKSREEELADRLATIEDVVYKTY